MAAGPEQGVDYPEYVTEKWKSRRFGPENGGNSFFLFYPQSNAKRWTGAGGSFVSYGVWWSTVSPPPSSRCAQPIHQMHFCTLCGQIRIAWRNMLILHYNKGYTIATAGCLSAYALLKVLSSSGRPVDQGKYFWSSCCSDDFARLICDVLNPVFYSQARYSRACNNPVNAEDRLRIYCHRVLNHCATWADECQNRFAEN